MIWDEFMLTHDTLSPLADWLLRKGREGIIRTHFPITQQLSPGHGKFEGRRPALMDSLLQAFLTAPFFVFFEYCFFFGLFQDLHHEVINLLTN